MSSSFVSRGGLKLDHALTTFNVNPAGLTCADLGCSTGGFTDCLLQSGASRVIAVDTAYGQFAWKLRNDPRVILVERTNALHANPPEPVDLLVVDLGWTPQRLLIPAALKWLKPSACIITLIKPHYELKASGEKLPPRAVLDDATAERITRAVLDSLPSLGVRVENVTPSPIRGSGSAANPEKGSGNAEWLALLSATTSPERRVS